MTPLEHALNYAQKGWRVIPITPGQKRPAINNWTQQATTDPHLITEWWTRWPNHGIGIATGQTSGIFAIDIDNTDSLHDLQNTHGQLPDTLTNLTGSGGHHLIYQWPHGRTIRNDQAGRLGPGLDIRGDGGQIVAPPTLHPNGTPYTWDLGQPDTPQPAPTWLIDLLDPPQPLPAAPRPTPNPRTHGDLPGDIWAQTTPYADLLEQDGATYLGTRTKHDTGDTYQLWSRPPMPGETDHTPHTSATLWPTNNTLNIFTTNWTHTNPETGEHTRLQPGSYSQFGYYTATRHAGNHKAAAAQLANEGHTPPWPDPQPLLPPPPPAPHLPLDALPTWIADTIQAVATELQTSPDIPATVALGCLSTIATAAHTRLHIQGTWHETPNLYLAASAPPGIGKSPAVTYLLRALETIETGIAAEAAQARANHDSRRRILDKQIKEYESRLAKGKDPQLERELEEANAELLALTPPPDGRLIADDVTPEAFTHILNNAGGTIAIISSEGGFFDQINRYVDKGKPPNLDAILKAWSGDNIRVDRKTGDPITITNPRAVITLTVQPRTVHRLHQDPDFTGRGLVARFMIVEPDINVGHRDLTRPQQDLTPHLDTWAEHLNRIWHTHRHQHITYQLEPEAAALFNQFRQTLELERRNDRSLATDGLREASTKVESSTARLALLLHIAQHPAPGAPVTAATMAQATRVGNWWMQHLWRINTSHGASPAQQLAARIGEWLLDTRPDTFTFTEVRDAVGVSRSERSLERFEPALRVLADRGWVSGDPGKARETYQVNPGLEKVISVQGVSNGCLPVDNPPLMGLMGRDLKVSLLLPTYLPQETPSSCPVPLSPLTDPGPETVPLSPLSPLVTLRSEPDYTAQNDHEDTDEWF